MDPEPPPPNPRGVAQLAERRFREPEAAGSNPVTPTKSDEIVMFASFTREVVDEADRVARAHVPGTSMFWGIP